MSIPQRLAWLIVSGWLLASPGIADPGPARLVADLAPGTLAATQGMSGFLPVGSRSVFVRGDNEHRPSLWVTDGTAEGTSLVSVLCPTCWAILPLASTGSVAFYRVSYDETVIWRTDGTPAGTFPLTSGLSLPRNGRFFHALNGGRLFLTACSPALGCELWSSDGTAAGTAPAGEIVPGPESADILQLAAAGDRAFLIARVPGEEAALWLADANGLTRLGEAPDARALAAQGNRAYFIARGAGFEVWTSDGTAAGTRPVTAFGPLEPFPEIVTLTLLDGRAYFMADDRAHGPELWSVGPRPGSLRRVTGFPGPLAAVGDIRKSGDRLVFAAAHGHMGLRVWSSRGDFRSSAPVRGCPGNCPMVFGPLAPVAPGRFVFYGQNQEGGGIWITDGTDAGTRLLQKTDRHWLVQAVAADGRVLIEITDEYETGELWVTDGTAAGTFFTVEGGPGWSHYYGWGGELGAGAANGRIVFPGLVAGGDDREELLWSSDGSRDGSHPIADARAGRGSYPYLTPFRDGLLARTCSDNGMEMRFVQGAETTLLLSSAESYCEAFFSTPVVISAIGGDVAVFLRLDGPMSLWRTDGTAAGTQALFPSSPAGGPVSLTRFGDEAAFSLSVRVGDTFHIEIWLTDGTAAGTRKQLELAADTEVLGLTSAAGRLWFFDSVRLPNGEYALQPWVSDGTAAGTYRLTGRNGYTLADRPTFTAMGGRVYFAFADLGAPLELWSTDGNPAGTGSAITAESGAAAPESLTAIGDRLYFTAPRTGAPAGPLLPWVSDGTDAGTALLADLDLRGDPNFAPPDAHPFVELDGRIFFAGLDLQHGDELWSTDGTPEDTARLLDIASGLMGSYPRGLTVWNGKLWFRARDAVHGMELWSSDGTAEGTRLVQDIAPGPSWSAPAEMAGIAEGLYFSAADAEHGRELWVVPDGEP